MRNRIGRIAGVLLLVVCVAIASIADTRWAATAMACCAKTHHLCAGPRTPDVCCKRMGHAGPGSVAATPASPQPLAPAGHVVITACFATPGSSTESGVPGFAFVRPHDPPHLHPYSLLI